MESELRILQLGKFHPIRGGVEKVAYDLTDGLSRRGIRCDLMCAATHGGDRVIPLNGLANIIRCRTWMRLASTMIAPSMIFALRKTRARYDIVHIHHPDPMACLALRLSGYKGKVVLHWHSDIIKQKTSLRFYRPLQTWLLRRADLIVGTSPSYIEGSPYLRDVRRKCVCLPIGVEPMPITDISRVRLHGKKVIFSLGRLVPYKGFEYLIRASRLLPDDYVVLIGGEGPLKESLRSEIEELHVADKVVLLGRIPDDELPSCFRACDLFCLPSVQKTEAFGIVQIEAMSCGKPVVTTNIPGSGVPWVNKHGVSGINVPPKDPEALACAILKIMEDGQLYQQYSRNAYERYQTVFTKDKMIDKTIHYYETIESDREERVCEMGKANMTVIDRQDVSVKKKALVVKRLFDIIGAISGIILLSPLFLIIYWIIKREDGAPVIFRQERIGYKGKTFTLYKFRSMIIEAEADGRPHLCEVGDKRLTRVGRFLRAHHLDELPQLWNVLKGEMSIVGYRPERKYFVDRIISINPQYTSLYAMRPGLFSTATLYNGYTDTMEKMLERLRMDLEYMRTWSLWEDLRIVWKTALSILTGKKF